MNLCIFRLSALGDATHVLALIDAIQQDARTQSWRIVWVLGPGEAKLVAGLPGVELVVYDKRHGLKGALALRQNLKAMLGGKPFDVLLQLQLALRANIVSRMIPAQRRIGFDRARSKELHSAVINERIDAGAGPHVLDAMLGFLKPLGLTRPSTLHWPLVVPEAAQAFAKQHLPDGKSYLVISPCSSHQLRNWLPQSYAAVANYAATELGLTPVLVGGKSAIETETAERIRAALCVDFIDLVGKDTLKQLLGLLQRATVVLSPDSGPAHMAQALGTPVVGLYAATDPARSGPYRYQNLCTNHYSRAAQQFLQKPVTRLRWGQKVEREGVMALISVAEVCALLRGAITSARVGLQLEKAVGSFETSSNH
jgi:heptosyltransferase I